MESAFLDRFNDQKFLNDLLYFVVVLAVAGILLNFLVDARPEMTSAQRAVAYHTNILVGVAGLHTEVYEYVVRIPNSNFKSEEIINRIIIYGFEESNYASGRELLVHKLHPDNERIVDLYLEEIRKQGLPVYVSKATVVLDEEPRLEADIIQECVGWVGMFAVIALIIAYPKVHWKKRLYGIFISLPLMYGMNVLRITTTILISRGSSESFINFTHDILWRTVLIAWALILWIFWIYFVVREKTVLQKIKKKVKRKKKEKGKKMKKFILLLILFSSIVYCGNWPMFHYDATHSGYTTDSGPTTNTTLWTYDTGGDIDGSPSVLNDRVFFAAQTADKLFAVNATNGTEIWNNTATIGLYTSTAAVGSSVYYGTLNSIVAVGVNDGSVSWSKDTGGTIYTGALVTENTVYIGSYSNSLHVYYAGNGTTIRTYATGDNVLSIAARSGNIIYFGSHDHRVYAYYATNSTQLWNFTTGGDVLSSPAVSGDIVYIGSMDNKLYALNATNGTQIWAVTTGALDVRSSPAVYNDVVYFGSDDNKLYARNATNGTLIWSFTTGGDVRSSPAVTDDFVYVGSYDNKIYAVHISNGTQLWNYTTGGAVHSSPAIANGILYVGSNDNQFYAIGTLPIPPDTVIIVTTPETGQKEVIIIFITAIVLFIFLDIANIFKQ